MLLSYTLLAVFVACLQLRLAYAGRMLTADLDQQQFEVMPGVRVAYVLTRLEGG
jgi:hypothetical protein